MKIPRAATIRLFIYTVMSTPPVGWSDASVNLGNYRYLRYRGPASSYGNVSEIEFYRSGAPN